MLMNSPSSLRRRALALCAAFAPGLLATIPPPPAHADSLAYVKAGDIHLSTTDGSRQYQVTFDGGYSSVSQADDGRMVALRGDRIRHLERDGRVIADIATPVSTTSDPNMSFRGPFDPAISPDGKRVAYTYYWQYIGEDPYCNPRNNCYVKRLYHGTGFTAPDRLTAWDEPGFLRRSGWKDAHWVDNDQVLLSDPYILPNEDVVLWNPSDADSLRRWFQDQQYGGEVGDAVISRDRSAMATITSGQRRMSVLRSEGLFYPGYPVRCFEASVEDQGADAKISSPTLSANGTRLFWAEGDGIHAATLPKFTVDGCGQLTDGGALLIGGASGPAWGPADVPPARSQPGGGGNGGGGGTGGGGNPGPVTGGPGGTPGGAPGGAPGGGGTVSPPPGGSGGPVATKVTLTVTRARLATVLTKGLDVRLRSARSGRHRITARVGGRSVGVVTAKVGSAGTARVRLRFTRTARRSLAKRRKLTVTVSGAGAKRTVQLSR